MSALYNFQETQQKSIIENFNQSLKNKSDNNNYSLDQPFKQAIGIIAIAFVGTNKISLFSIRNWIKSLVTIDYFKKIDVNALEYHIIHFFNDLGRVIS